jgi:hypothetical protein
MKESKSEAVIAGLFVVISVVAVLAVTGWVKNIVKLCHCDFASPYKAEVCYGVGVIPPIGAVMGWINIEDKKQGE